MGVGGQRLTQAALCLGKLPDSHCIGGWVGPVPAWMGVENLAPPGFDPWTTQPIVSRVTTSNNGGKWNSLQVLQTLPEQHTGKVRSEGTTANSHTGRYFRKCKCKSTKHSAWKYYMYHNL